MQRQEVSLAHYHARGVDVLLWCLSVCTVRERGMENDKRAPQHTPSSGATTNEGLHHQTRYTGQTNAARSRQANTRGEVVVVVRLERRE
ncbi:hypothetical protein Pcinc_034956 [Petrolisthes cinctipes]|uniref:Uncharacterized protein n=1 Tax=Petrolisthes cinctipes TaxID=88211 RepID=A0AAE1BXQ0_PETCI|nr:hypothetical protein Pcinc_034956 [Petrolisthes cinctipes]